MDINTKCQVFTPKENVVQLLDNVGYINDLYGLKIAENSCGDGNILSEIVVRYIEDCIRHNIPKEQIKNGLEQDIYGAEIDKIHRDNCIKKLDGIAASYGISNVKWNMFNGDFLKQNIVNKFDYVIGNPPYISYLELSEDIRSFLKENFSVCQYGKIDYCYAFIEAGIKSLTPTGKLAYLIPSNIFKNEFAYSLRQMLLLHLTNIYDFTNSKLFKNKLTASAIIIYDNIDNSDCICYHDVLKKRESKIAKASLTRKWKFNYKAPSNNSKKTIRFGDIFHTASSIATLLNKVFIIGDFKEEGNYIVVGNYKIEKEIIRKAVSPRSLNQHKSECVIFPYYYKDGLLARYTPQEFANKFPLTTSYLKQFESELDKRDSDKNTNWFEYGRSQALAHLNQRKLLISTLITKKVKTYILQPEIIPTSGLYIISRSKYSLEMAQKILESPKFFEYVKNIGVISNGNSFRISPKDINDYHFPYTEGQVEF